MHVNGENFQNVICREKLFEIGQMDNIHVYYHNIQRSFSLKPFG